MFDLVLLCSTMVYSVLLAFLVVLVVGGMGGMSEEQMVSYTDYVPQCLILFYYVLLWYTLFYLLL
jgi:hypothetical protein